MPVIMGASERGILFIGGHEGFVSTTYLCPAGVPTIGKGFTMRSRVFAEYWRRTRGRGLEMGDTITREESRHLLGLLVDEEYGAAVAREVRARAQHRFDAAASVAYNCGPGALGWRWAKALANGDVHEAASRLRSTAITANGRQLAGLVRRRAEEAELLEHGNYRAGAHGANEPAVSRGRVEVSEYQQQLKTLGYHDGAVDGIAGPVTKEAVRRFQGDAGLTVDGIVGPATRAALVRALDAKRQQQAVLGGGATGAAGGGLAAEDLPATADAMDMVLVALGAGAGLALVALGVFLLLRYRGRLTGRRVPT